MNLKSPLLLFVGVTALPFSPLFPMEENNLLDPDGALVSIDPLTGSKRINKKYFKNVPPGWKFAFPQFLLPWDKSNVDFPTPRSFFFSSWKKGEGFLRTPKESTISNKDLTIKQKLILKLPFKKVDGVFVWQINGKIAETGSLFFKEEPESNTNEKEKESKGPLSPKEFFTVMESLEEIDRQFKNTQEEDVKISLKEEMKKTIDSLLMSLFYGAIKEGYTLKESSVGEESKDQILNEFYKKKLNFLKQVQNLDVVTYNKEDLLLSKEEEEEIENETEYRMKEEEFVQTYNKRIHQNNEALSLNARAHALTMIFSAIGGGVGVYGTHKFFYHSLLKKGIELEETVTPYLPHWVKNASVLSWVMKGIVRNSLWVCADGAGLFVGLQIGHMVGALVVRIIWGSLKNQS